MKQIPFLALGAFAWISAAYAQDAEGLKKNHRELATTSSAPVTEAEADATFRKLDRVLNSVLHLSLKPRTGSYKPTATISRFEVVSEFMRMYKEIEPHFTSTPEPVHVDESRLSYRNSAEKKALIFLVSESCIGNYGPLATGKTWLTIHDFGDSLGYFVTRISSNTNIPSSKWTPYLHGN